MLAGKCVIIGVTGGIAAYKVPDLASRLVKEGADVHVIMTESAAHFITPLTFQTVSRNPVITGIFEEPKGWEVQHISLADKADLVVVVPATANIIGKVNAGIADDMLSTTIMATTAPVLFAPAMNVHMYENPIVQSNIDDLKKRGYHFLEPDTGRLACGYEGKGRLPGIDVIHEAICGILSAAGDLSGRTVLVTAGPTREYIDPVRFISNGSTGKMGYAIAEAATKRGAHVILISGPVNLSPPAGVEFIPVTSARDMFEAVSGNYTKADIIIKTAAVGDYRPKNYHSSKFKKGEGDINLELERNPDILHFLGQNKGNRLLIGFAAETDDIIENASKKVRSKNLDMIVANDITKPGAGFEVDTNIVKFLYKDGQIEELGLMSKKEIAHIIFDKLICLQDKL